MTSQRSIYQQFLDGLWTATDETSLRAVAARLTEQMGYDAFAYFGMGDDGPVLLTTYDRRWRQHYFERHYEDVDPVVSDAKVAVNPFTWHGESPAVLRSARKRRFFSEAADFGIRHGVTLPINGAFGRFAALTMAGGRDDRDSRRAPELFGSMLQLSALQFHARVELVLRPENRTRPVLTQRETECLAWSARGKTMSEASCIMGLSPRTVAFHLENARLKLGATNVTHAVALALKRNLLR